MLVTKNIKPKNLLLEMRLIRSAVRTLNGDLCRQRRHLSIFGPGNENRDSKNSFESAEDFERRIFGGFPGTDQDSSAFYQKLDKIKRAGGRGGFGPDSSGTTGGGSQVLDGLDESFSTLSDGMDGKLMQTAKMYFEMDLEEVNSEGYAFRPDLNFSKQETYEPKDLDITKTPIPRTPKRYEFETTTEEVLRKADFRNVRFLANFITEAGIIIKRSSTKISAKAQRKVAREIKTARAFGLMPFTTMGEYPFVFGRTREDLSEEEVEEERYHRSNAPRDGFVRRGLAGQGFVEEEPIREELVEEESIEPIEP